MSARLSSTAPCRVAPCPRRASTPSRKSLAAPTTNSSTGHHRPCPPTARASAPGSTHAAPRRTTPSASAAAVTSGPNLRSLGHPDRAAPPVAAQENIERARTPVAGAGGGEAEHDARRAPARQPRLEPLLQHRRLVLRVAAAAVHDEHAAMPEHDRLREEAVHGD